MTEEWRPIPGIDGYMASSHGRIKSLSRKTFNGKGYFISKEKILTGHIHMGYLRVKVNNMHKFVHVLVGGAFCDADPDRNFFNHKDTVKTNNFACNLERCTKSENSKHAFEHGLTFNAFSVCNPNKVLDEVQVLTIKSLLKDPCRFFSMAKIARYFNVTPENIYGIKSGASWSAV
jgi:hypothetical protein